MFSRHLPSSTFWWDCLPVMPSTPWNHWHWNHWHNRAVHGTKWQDKCKYTSKPVKENNANCKKDWTRSTHQWQAAYESKHFLVFLIWKRLVYAMKVRSFRGEQIGISSITKSLIPGRQGRLQGWVSWVQTYTSVFRKSYVVKSRYVLPDTYLGTIYSSVAGFFLGPI